MNRCRFLMRKRVFASSILCQVRIYLSFRSLLEFIAQIFYALFHSDIIQGLAPVEFRSLLDKKQIVVTRDNRSHSRLVLIGVNTRDRPGLLLDISKCLLQFKLQVHRTEAAVFDEQSVSVWRCSHIENEEFDVEQISAMLRVSVSMSPLFGCGLFKDLRSVDVSFADASRR